MILGIGQNRKFRNLRNWYFFLIKPHYNVIVPFFRCFVGFRFWISYTTENWSKIGTALSQTVSMHSVHPLLRSGDVGIWEFCVFLGGQNIFNFRGLSYDGGLYFLGGGQFILCPCSHFELQGCKFLPATPSFSSCTFSGLIWMQGFK